MIPGRSEEQTGKFYKKKASKTGGFYFRQNVYYPILSITPAVTPVKLKPPS
jgi:hypothetical protein